MSLWTSHRQRQALRYARASYRLQRWEAERTEAHRRVIRAAIRADVRAKLRALQAADIPPRPDSP